MMALSPQALTAALDLQSRQGGPSVAVSVVPPSGSDWQD